MHGLHSHTASKFDRHKSKELPHLVARSSRELGAGVPRLAVANHPETRWDRRRLHAATRLGESRELELRIRSETKAKVFLLISSLLAKGWLGVVAEVHTLLTCNGTKQDYKTKQRHVARRKSEKARSESSTCGREDGQRAGETLQQGDRERETT